MEEIVSKNKCVGCFACYNICPKNAITMEKGTLGFKYPNVNDSKCINCGLCIKICPIYRCDKKQDFEEKCYVAYSKQEENQINSSSGGIFPIIANYVLDKKGVVVGSAFDSNLCLRHVAISSKEDLNLLLGSKYLQSEIGNVFRVIKELLNTKYVLFVGTPCQVAGLKSFLDGDNDNLICIDLICHGVPSTELFERYISEIEVAYKDKVIDYKFRDKSTGWENYSNTIHFVSHSVSQLATDNEYMKLFLTDIALRESCYNCQFKLDNKYSDITLGDFWGVNSSYPEIYNPRGTSAVIINTEKGKEIFNSIKKDVICQQCYLEEILRNNPVLKQSVAKNKLRNNFIEDINCLSVKQLSKKYCKRKTAFGKLVKRFFVFGKKICKLTIK